jgi:hypothetical protein
MHFWRKLFGRSHTASEKDLPASELLQHEITEFSARYPTTSAEDVKAVQATLSEFSRMMKMPDSVAIKMIERKGWTAGDTLFTALAGICIEVLMSGRLHADKGVLNPLGDAYVSFFDHCLAELSRSGRLTVTQSMREADDLEMIVANTGAAKL